jgi:hypothetical protein
MDQGPLYFQLVKCESVNRVEARDRVNRRFVTLARRTIAFLLTGAIVAGSCAALADPGDAVSTPGLGSANDYVTDSSESTGAYEIGLLGIEVNDGVARLKDGHPVSGVEIIKIVPNGAAAAAGLHGRHEGAQVALTIGLLAGAVFFPPAMLGMMALQQSGLGSSHELIIAVDAQRTRDVADLGDALTKAHAGEIVYLTVVSGGEREQIPVELPVGQIPVQAKADQ